MSILIKNMEMPKNEELIIICSDSTVEMTNNDGSWVYKQKAVEVKPHGRLIDANILLEEAYKLRMWLLEHNMAGAEHWVTKIYQIIDEAPVVIEADIEDIPMEYFEAGGK